MSFEELPPAEVMWEGNFVRAMKRDRWEYVSRARNVNAVVIVAEDDGKVVLIDQYRVPAGRRSVELPAGLVGDEDEHATVEETAIKELEEETGYTAERVETLGEFMSSPGLLAEGFTLVRAHGLHKVGPGGGTEHEDINVHLVARADIPNFLDQKRAEGFAVDVKLLMFLGY